MDSYFGEHDVPTAPRNRPGIISVRTHPGDSDRIHVFTDTHEGFATLDGTTPVTVDMQPRPLLVHGHSAGIGRPLCGDLFAKHVTDDEDQITCDQCKNLIIMKRTVADAEQCSSGAFLENNMRTIYKEHARGEQNRLLQGSKHKTDWWVKAVDDMVEELHLLTDDECTRERVMVRCTDIIPGSWLAMDKERRKEKKDD